MDFFREYTKYIKHNPQGYWFKRKLYGYGWVPAKAAGWITLGIYATVVLVVTILVSPQANEAQTVGHVVLPLFGATLVLLIIVWKTGEPPKWQWGEKEDEE